MYASRVHWFLLGSQVLVPGETAAYVFGWQLYSHTYGARCQFQLVDDTLVVIRDAPLVLCSLREVIIALMAVGGPDASRQQLYWESCSVDWSFENWRTASLHVDAIERIAVQRRKYVVNHTRTADDCGEIDLESELGHLMADCDADSDHDILDDAGACGVDDDEVAANPGPEVDPVDPLDELAANPVGNLIAWVKLSFFDSEHREHISLDARHLCESAKAEMQRCRELAANHEHAAQPLDGFLSLVRTDTEDSFVLWSNVEQRVGRRISLDGRWAIKWMIPGLVPPGDFSRCELVISRLPVLMVKAKGHDRTRMPGWCLRLWFFLQAQRFGGPIVQRQEECCLCVVARSRGFSTPTPAHHDMYVCCACSVVWHADCALNMSQDINFEPRFVCPVCNEQ